MQFTLFLFERILEGDIGATVFVTVPFALAIWYFIYTCILSARQWKSPSGPQERTHFYRKKKVTAQKKSPDAGP